jgi:hypothetical protein
MTIVTKLIAGAALGVAASCVSAETVFVKYRGPVELSSFHCDSIDRSSLVERLCYDARKQYAIVSLKGTYYHYCRIPTRVIASWREAPSMGRFYQQNVRGEFDCRLGGAPE